MFTKAERGSRIKKHFATIVLEGFSFHPLHMLNIHNSRKL